MCVCVCAPARVFMPFTSVHVFTCACVDLGPVVNSECHFNLEREQT